MFDVVTCSSKSRIDRGGIATRLRVARSGVRILNVLTSAGIHPDSYSVGRLRLKCGSTCAETRFHLSAQWTNPFKSLGHQFSRLLAAELCESAVAMLDAPRSEVV